MEYISISKEDGSIKKVSLEEIIDKTEGSGYWKEGTVKEMLDNGLVVWTPFSIFKPQATIKGFIEHCINDDEFWLMGGIPSNEEFFINNLNMTDEQLHKFYEALCTLQQLSKKIN